MTNDLLKNKIDAIKYFGVKIITAIKSMILLFVFSYYLEPSIYGKYSLVIGLLYMLVGVFISWISSASKRYYYKYKNKKNMYYSNILFLAINMILLITIFLFLLYKFNLIIDTYELFIISLLISISLAFVSISENILMVAGKSNIYSIVTILQCIFQILLLYFGLIFYNLNIMFILATVFLSNIIYVVIGLYKLKNTINNTKELSIKFHKKFISYGLPALGLWIFSWILDISDRYLINYFLDVEKVAIYDINYKISANVVNLFITPIILAVYPLLIKLWNQNEIVNVKELLKETIGIYFLVLSPVVLGIISISNNLYGFFVSEFYSQGILIILFISIGLFFNGLVQILYKIWKLYEKTKIIFFISLITVIINIILNILLIPKYGYISASITTLISYFLSFLITLFMFNKIMTIKINYLRNIKIVFSSIFMFICVKSIDLLNIDSQILNILFKIFIGVFTYLLSLKVTGVLKNEIKNLKKYLNKTRK